MDNIPHRIVIIGGGAAGITVAAELRHHAKTTAIDVTIIDPSDVHYYQPAFTLVGAGAYSLPAARRSEGSLIPPGTKWFKDHATGIDPRAKRVNLGSGDSIPYDVLIVCPGLECHWSGISGLAETLGQNGVCSNYSPAVVTYTWACIKALRPGDKALFTQPAMPIKCPGAPQKIAYLTADNLRRRGIREHCEVQFFTQAPAIFGVPMYAKALVKVAARHNIGVNYRHNLVEIDGRKRLATFEIADPEQRLTRAALPFDMLHVTPPQRTPAFLRESPVANADGFVDVDAATLQHKRLQSVFGLGDAAGTANSKTAAAVRKQAPVVVCNVMSFLRGEALTAAYDGYAACPLTTAYDRVLMAEFIYGGKPTPTLPLDPRKDGRTNWLVKKYGLPALYWDYMLKGHKAFPAHNAAYVEPAE